MPGREPRARQHEARLAVGDLDRDPGADRRALPRPEHRLLERVQIEAGVARVRARRQQRLVVEPPDVQALSTAVRRGAHANGRLSANSW